MEALFLQFSVVLLKGIKQVNGSFLYCRNSSKSEKYFIYLDPHCQSRCCL